MMLPAGAVQAASSTGYVMGELTRYKEPEKITTVGGYQVKLLVQDLYARKSKNGKWKKLASGVNCFTTNGATVYFVKGSKSTSCKIYAISVKGGKTRKIKTISKTYISNIYCYKDRLYLTETKGNIDNELYVYSMKTKKHSLFSRPGADDDQTVLWGAYKENGIVLDERYHKGSTSLYTMNLLTRKNKRIEKNAYFHCVSGKYVYYAAYARNENLNTYNNTFVIKRATVDGKNIKKLTKSVKGYVVSITPHSVQYRTEAWGKVKTLKF